MHLRKKHHIAHKQQQMNVSVYDMMGKLVKQTQHNNAGKVNVDLSNQTTGTYIIKIVSDNDTQQEKITIVK